MFSEPFPNVFHVVCSLKWPAIIKNFTLGLQLMVLFIYLFFEQHESVGRSLIFRVLAYRRNTVVGEILPLSGKIQGIS